MYMIQQCVIRNVESAYTFFFPRKFATRKRNGFILSA